MGSNFALTNFIGSLPGVSKEGNTIYQIVVESDRACRGEKENTKPVLTAAKCDRFLREGEGGRGGGGY